jgi:hypothetical protein
MGCPEGEEEMTSSRVARLGASVLMSLVLMAGLTSGALGASLTVVTTPSPTIDPTAGATGTQTGSQLARCLPPGSSSRPRWLDCAPQARPSIKTRAEKALPATAATYSIKGTVTGPGGVLLGNIDVIAESSDNYGFTSTASDGTYSILVASGTYTVSFADNANSTYLSGYYSSSGFTLKAGSATPVTVGTADVTGVNAQLQTGHHIKGTVTGPGGAPLAGIDVYAESSNYSGYAMTGPSGTYSAVVASGTYTVSFDDSGYVYVAGYYSSTGLTLDYGSATPVTVGTADVTGINVQLQTGHYIKGTVTGPGGAPLGDVWVCPEGSDRSAYCAPTASDGTYSALVASGTYTVFFDNSTYLSGYYSSTGFTLDYGSATPVTVGTADVTSINVQLLAGHYIKGTVTGPGGTPLADIGVCGDSSGYSGCASTGSNGAYSMLVASGTYTVSFDDSTAKYFDGYYSSAGFTLDYSSATPVTVGTSDVTLVNVQLQAGHHWSVTLDASATTVISGTSVTLTAYSIQDVWWTPYYLVIVAGDGSVLAACAGGYTCTATVSSSAPASATYHAVVGTSTGTAPQATANPVTVTWVPVSTYHAITPTRVLDTRNGTGGLSGPFTNHVARTFTVAGVPAGATAVTGNLTVTGQTSSGYLFIGPVATNNPGSSTLNFPVGDDRANAVTVALSGTGTLSITFVAPSNGPTAHAIFDVTGYFTPDTTGATYHALTPTRALDTRNGTGGLGGPFTNHAARTFTVAGVPSGAIAVTGNLTVTGQTSSGYFSIGPVATDNPTSSTLNFPVGDDRANAVTVALGAGRTLSITFVAPSNGPTAHAIFDVTGYFTADMSGAVYVPLNPTRLLDTRNGTGGLSGPFTNHAARTFGVSGGSSGVPSGATAVTGNLTVTGQTSSGYLFIGPVATNNPGSSTLNFPVGDDRANAVTVALSGTGTLSITFVAPSNGPTVHAIFDVTGCFVPVIA